MTSLVPASETKPPEPPLFHALNPNPNNDIKLELVPIFRHRAEEHVAFKHAHSSIRNEDNSVLSSSSLS